METNVARIPWIAIMLAVALAPAATGCRCPSKCCLPATPCMPCNLDTTHGEATPPDLMHAVPDCDAGECRLEALPAPGDQYHVLTPGDCQCRAATNANVANMVVLEEHWATVIIECDSKYVAKNMCLQRDLLELHAGDIRNKAAAAALESYYQLAGLEARKYYLDMAIDETSKSLDRATKLHEQGLPVDVDRDQLAGDLSQLEDRKVQLQYARVQLNGQLQKLTGCPVSEHDFFWPEVDWRPDMAPLDADAELAGSINNRFDMRGISLTLNNLEKSTLRVARGVLKVVDGTTGAVEPTPGWIHKLRCIRCSGHEVDVRCRQLSMLYSDTEQLATAEIKGAVYEVTMQQQRVALARKAVQERRENLYALTNKREAQDVPIFKLTQAKNRLYDAESDLIETVAALKIAETHLKRDQAALAAECGFNPKLCREGCSTGACSHCVPTCPSCESGNSCAKCGG